MMWPRPKAGGFSLIEVSLAIFVVASGMLIMFSLFPSGLRQVETAQTSTQEALFGDYVLSTLRAESLKLSSSDWDDIRKFQDIVQGITGRRDLDRMVTVDFPENTTSSCRYVLSITDAGGGLKTVFLWCQSGQYGATDMDVFKAASTKFYSELFYSGMP